MIQFRVRQDAICLACGDYVGDRPLSNSLCSCPSHKTPDTAFIYKDSVYRYLEADEEGYIKPIIYLGEAKDLLGNLLVE